MGYPGGGAPPAPGYVPQPRIRFEAIGEGWRLFTEQIGTWVAAVLIYVVIVGGVSVVLNLLTQVW